MPTPIANVRHCDHCNKDVTLAMSKAHLARLVAEGACVAVIWGKLVNHNMPKRVRLGLPRTSPNSKLRDFTDTL
jgi:hypothetical protein